MVDARATRLGDGPILHPGSHPSLGDNINGPSVLAMPDWHESDPVALLRPERSWEGADRPLEPSIRSVAPGRVNQLRDPALLDHNGFTWLCSAVAGEHGIAVARLDW